MSSPTEESSDSFNSLLKKSSFSPKKKRIIFTKEHFLPSLKVVDEGTSAAAGDCAVDGHEQGERCFVFNYSTYSRFCRIRRKGMVVLAMISIFCVFVKLKYSFTVFPSQRTSSSSFLPYRHHSKSSKATNNVFEFSVENRTYYYTTETGGAAAFEADWLKDVAIYEEEEEENDEEIEEAEPWDVNGPPVRLNSSDTLESLLDRIRTATSTLALPTTSQGMTRQAFAKAEAAKAASQEAATKKAKKKHKYNQRSSHTSKKRGKSGQTDIGGNRAGKEPWPVIHYDDAAEPKNIGPLHAADSLLCRESVINFVINATDGKDECEGLKKAFDKTCGMDPVEDEQNDQPPRRTQRQQRNFQRRKLTLWTKTNSIPKIKTFLFKNYRLMYKLAEYLLLRGRTEFFFAEEQVVDYYDDAAFLVDHQLDFLVNQDLRKQWLSEKALSRRRRSLEESLDVATPTKHLNVTKKRPEVFLSVPTANQHMSEEVLSGTLLLQQGDKIIQKAQNLSHNNAEAIHDAQMSSKAIADTSAAISAVLNDPTSVEARTCCASILNVYHENCSTDEEEQISDSRLLFVVFVILLCGMVKSIIRYFKILWLPEAAGCILVGVLSGYVLMYFPEQNLSFDGNWFLRIMVPPIIFEAALSIDKRAFNRHIVPIMIYAVFGTLFATGLTALIVHKGTKLLSPFCSTIPYVDALTFGALISSIDPIAVLSVLSNMGMTDTHTIYVVIFGESLLNDGVAIVLFHTLVHFLDENLLIDAEAVWAAAVHFLIVAVGSLLIGVASGMMSTVYYWLFHGCQTPLVEVLMFLCWALLPYYVCDGIGWSGIVSAVATGFVMDWYVVGQKQIADSSDHGSQVTGDSSDKLTPPSVKHNGSDHRGSNAVPADENIGGNGIFSPAGHLSEEARHHIGFVTEIISTTMETAIFAYLGLFLFSHRYHWNVFHTIIAILACCVSRALMIPLLSLLANWITRIQQHRASCRQQGSTRKTSPNSNTPAGVVIDPKMQLVLWFAGLRGAMSFALVEHIPLYDSVSGEGSRHKPELKAMTSASILFTVFVLGGYTYYMMDRLGLAPSSQVPRRSSHYEMTSLLNGSDSIEDDDTSNTTSKTLFSSTETTMTNEVGNGANFNKRRAAYCRQRGTGSSLSGTGDGSEDSLQQF